MSNYPTISALFVEPSLTYTIVAYLSCYGRVFILRCILMIEWGKYEFFEKYSLSILC